jgi:N-acetylneuraminic acid mutarotase
VKDLIQSDRALPRVSLGLVALGLFSLTLSTRADPPVITNPFDLRVLSINETFDPFAVSPGWVEKAPMPTARIAFATVALDGKIYAIGGKGANSDKCDAIQTVEAYDPGTDTWERGLMQPPTARYKGAGAALGGLIYLVGGEDRSMPDVCGDVVATVEAYDPVADSWSTKASLRFPRTQVSLAVDEANNKLYAIGGSNGFTGGFVADKIVEVYDPTQDTWTRLKNMTTARALPSVGVINGKIYALGGQDAGNVRIATVEDYDIATNQWTLHQSAQSMMPFPYLNPAFAVIEGKIYVVGGEGSVLINLGPQPTVQVYTPGIDGMDSWTASLLGDASLPPMPGGRRFLGAAVVNDILYAIGGEAPNATQNQPLIYQITATNNPASYGASDLPMGLVVDSTLGIISSSPSVFGPNFPVTLSATNSDNETGSKMVNFYILQDPELADDALRIVSGLCATGRAGQPFSFQVLTRNATSAAIFSASGVPYVEGVGPELTIDQSTGLISGTVTPTSDNKPQSFGVTLAVSDLVGTVTAQSLLQLTFITEPAPTVPIISSSLKVTLALNKFFSYTITADAPADTFTYIDGSGTLGGPLPAGLTFDPDTHTISGIYTGEPTSRPTRGKSSATTPARAASLPHHGDSIETIKKEPPPKIQMCVNAQLSGVSGRQSDGNQTGTAPLIFIPSLHDYEIETLATDSGGTEYTVFTDDPEASGTGAGLLHASQVGEFVTYTVPVPVAGTYDVRVGIKTNKGKGIFQLYIDDIPQGAPQDEYSPLMEHTVVDLGPHKFCCDETQPSSFKFLVVGQNPMSIDYQLVVDYIDLVPRGEAEGLPRASSAPLVRVNDANFSGGFGTLLQATDVNDFVSYTVPVNVAGYYDIKVGTRTGTGNGIFQLAIDGVNLGYTQDEYASTTGYPVLNLGTILLDQGDKTFKFSVAGRNPSSTGYALVFDYIDLVLASQDEAETLPVSGTATISTVTDPVLSGGQGRLLKANAMNDSMTFTVPIPEAGTYTIKAGSRTSGRSGKFQLLVDEVKQGGVEDQYSALTGYQVYDLGTVTFTGSGESAFQFLVTDKNSNSVGYHLLFDYIELVR